ncbi:hypothetical protein HDU91_005011, partial [Kappamyces sp. JEL0680]
YSGRENWSPELCRYNTQSKANDSADSSTFDDSIAVFVSERQVEIFDLYDYKKPKHVIPFSGGKIAVLDQDIIAVANEKRIQIWDKLTLTELSYIDHCGPVHLLVSSQGTQSFLASTSSNRLYVWDYETEELRGSVKFDYCITCLLIVEVDFQSYIYVALANGTLLLWSVEEKQAKVIIAETGEAITQLKIGIFDSELVFTRLNDCALHIWDIDAKQEVIRFEGHGVPITAFDVCHETKDVVSVDSNFLVHTWDLAKYRSKPNSSDQLVLPESKNLHFRLDAATKLLVICFGDVQPVLCDLSIRIPKRAGKRKLNTILADPHHLYDNSTLLVISESGEVITTVSRSRLCTYDKFGSFLAESEKPLTDVFCLYLSKEGKYILTCSNEGDHQVATIWDANCRVVGQLQRDYGDITAADIFDDGQYFVTGSSSGRVCIYNQQFEIHKQFRVETAVTGVTLNQDLSLVAIASAAPGKTRQSFITIFDLNMNCVASFYFNAGWTVTGLHFGPGSKIMLLSGTPQHKAVIYDYVADEETKELEHCFVGGNAVSYSNNLSGSASPLIASP